MNVENLELKKTVEPDNDFKNMIVEYVGTKLKPDDQNVTVEMIIDVMANEFPEVVLVLAEENWVRGYQQGLDDVEAGKGMLEQNSEQKKNCKLCES